MGLVLFLVVPTLGVMGGGLGVAGILLGVAAITIGSIQIKRNKKSKARNILFVLLIVVGAAIIAASVVWLVVVCKFCLGMVSDILDYGKYH